LFLTSLDHVSGHCAVDELVKKQVLQSKMVS
jgi:hypothetical protein